jgi:hypothetical protein
MKIVINRCYGGFDLSKEAQDIYCAWARIKPGAWNATWNYYSDFHVRDLKRNDNLLATIIEYLGDLADSKYSELKVVEIPDDVDWYVKEYDGIEWVAEKHRTWS